MSEAKMGCGLQIIYIEFDVNSELPRPQRSSRNDGVGSLDVKLKTPSLRGVKRRGNPESI